MLVAMVLMQSQLMKSVEACYNVLQVFKLAVVELQCE